MADLEGNDSSLGKRKVFHELGELVHLEDRDGKGFQKEGEELDDVLKRVFIKVAGGLLLAKSAAGLEDLVDVFDVTRVALNTELEESNLDIQQFCELDGSTLDLNDAVNVILEHCEEVKVGSQSSSFFFFFWVRRVGSKICETVHQSDEDGLDVNVVLHNEGAGLEELFEGVDVVDIGESLDDTIHEVLLGDLVILGGDDLNELVQDELLVYGLSTSFQLGKSDQVLTDGDLKIVSFLFSL